MCVSVCVHVCVCGYVCVCVCVREREGGGDRERASARTGSEYYFDVCQVFKGWIHISMSHKFVFVCMFNSCFIPANQFLHLTGLMSESEDISP